ncbi:PREDICTED: putative leucine-rich repeat-containing protein DDB_G0290503 [Trachymyrmex septentrionalis]|uniref:putative leucine-rich repeat-containing protein DDB_G0290503 n=1 Tax=Trachymyrmex septentrionalis TaxID=34720 RepID=UPI00084F1396|nr:PREDICTED: putative leucine-rich repeat-containing protein DDB_G0290503 [Trachymyrmex septentrionalis]
MWPRSSVLFVINALIVLVHSLPSNIDWNTSRNDLDSVAQNENILKLFLQLATHTANRLTYLRKKSEKEYDCNRRNDTPSISTTEAVVTQSPSQTNLEGLDNSQKILSHSFSSDPEINSDKNQTVFSSQLQKLSDLQNIDDNQDVERNPNLNMSDLIPKSVQDVQDASFNVTGRNHEFNSNTSQKSILDSDTSSNSLNANKFRPDFPKSARKVNQALVKNNTNTATMNDLTETVNRIFPNSQNLQEPALKISQRLFDTNLAPIIPKIISNVHENANQYILSQNTQNIRTLLDKNNDIKQKLFDSNIENMNTQIDKQNNLPLVKILSNSKNIVEPMSKVLPETAKGPKSNLLFQDIIAPLKSVEESQNHLAQFDYFQQKQSENAKQVGNQFDAGTSGKKLQETRVNDLSTNENNSTVDDSKKQSILKNSTFPFLRFLSDLNELENNNNKTKIDSSSIQINESANSSIDEELSIKEESKLTDVATSVLPNQIEFNTLTSITEHQIKSLDGVQDSKNINDVIKSDLENGKNLQDNLSVNDRINRLSENQITRIDDNLLDSNNCSLINNLKNEDLYVQLSEAKLQEISDQLINALQPIIEKRMDNNQTYMTGYYNK